MCRQPPGIGRQQHVERAGTQSYDQIHIHIYACSLYPYTYMCIYIIYIYIYIYIHVCMCLCDMLLFMSIRCLIGIV